jgi:hypothetical protein
LHGEECKLNGADITWRGPIIMAVSKHGYRGAADPPSRRLVALLDRRTEHGLACHQPTAHADPL